MIASLFIASVGWRCFQTIALHRLSGCTGSASR